MTAMSLRMRLVGWNAAWFVSGSLQLAGSQVPMLALIAGGR
jgi:hypothetical protein